MSAILPTGLIVPKFEPKHFVGIDFETFWDVDFTLKKLTTSDYIKDPRFEVLGAGVKIDGGAAEWLEEDQFRSWVTTWPWEETAIICQHAHFEGLISSWHYGFAPGFWLDTYSLSRALGLPGGLDELALHFKVGEKGEGLVKSKGKHRKDFTAEEWEEFGDYCKNDIEITEGIIDKMLVDFPEPELWLADLTIRLFTEPQLMIHEPRLREFLTWERERKEALLARIGLDKKTVGSNDKLAAAFVRLGAEPPRKLSLKAKNPDGSPKEGYAFAKSDPGMQELLEHENDEIRWLAEARIAVKSTQAETRAERFLRMGKDSALMPVYLKTWGAHTGRWTASDKTQFHNLQRTSKKDPRKGALKKALIAPEGQQVVAADSGAIEARGTAWLAGHETLLASFRENRDVYSEFASVAYGRPIDRKKNPEDELPGFLGKICCLGLGYGMGWSKLSLTLLAGAMGGAPVQLTEKDAETMGVDLDRYLSNERYAKQREKMVSRLNPEALGIHCACAEHLVKIYRAANDPIVQLWYQMEDVLATMESVEEGEEYTFGPGECMTIVRHGIILPSGFKLRYPGLRCSDEDSLFGKAGYSYLSKYKQRQHIYGGLACENVIQGLARIVIGEQWLSLKAKYDYKACLSTHDEIVIVVDDAEAPLAKRRMIEEMKIAPKWAAGWPLHAEGGFSKAYGDAK